MTPRTDAHTIRKGSETVLSSHIESTRLPMKKPATEGGQKGLVDGKGV